MDTGFWVFAAGSVHIAILYIFMPSSFVGEKYSFSIFRFEIIRSSHISRVQGWRHDSMYFTQTSLHLSSPVPTHRLYTASLATVERCTPEKQFVPWRPEITSNCTKWRSKQWQTQYWHWLIRGAIQTELQANMNTVSSYEVTEATL